MASVNHSIESTTSSLQRSGLSMSVGDTKSIVLALQALQDKIRRLEQDRNHHQDQYEKALHAHEAYKQDMEQQLEEERATHRKREKELQEMVQRAAAEKTKLQETLDESRKDLGTFRTELEEMLLKECDAAQKRENALASEVAKLRQEIEEQHKKHRDLLASIEELRAEKEAALDTNHHLEQAIEELMRMSLRKASATVNRSQVWNGDSFRLTAEKSRCSGPRGRRSARGAAETTNRRSSLRRTAELHARNKRPSSVPRGAVTRCTYRDPTYSSLQRDIRKDGSGPVMEESFRSEIMKPEMLKNDAIAELCRELQEEQEGLHREYKEMVERAAAEKISAEVLTAALNRLAALMDRKREQIQLIKEAQREFVSAGVAVDVPTSQRLSAPKRRPTPVGSDKTTQRNLIVNELRSLFSQQRP